MSRNIEAFELLSQAINSEGVTFKRSDIITNCESPEELVAHGLEREAQVINTHPVYLCGTLSVRALMASDGIVDPFGSTSKAKVAPKWLIRTRLTFDAPSNRQKLEAGPHLVGAVSTLSADAPKILDDFTSATDDGYDEAVSSVATSEYFHNLPGRPNVYINPAIENYPRTLMLRKWIRQTKGCMDMLSPTSEGQISTDELPNTINWLLQDSRTLLAARK